MMEIVGNGAIGDMGGDNTIRPCEELSVWIKKQGVPFGRDKARHSIKNYCSSSVQYEAQAYTSTSWCCRLGITIYDGAAGDWE